MAQSFRGGLRLPVDRALFDAALERYGAGETVRLPLDFDGARYRGLVGRGQKVARGEPVAACGEGENEFYLHAPVSGTVREASAEAIVVENDFKETPHSSVAPFAGSVAKAEPREIEEVLRQKGLVDPVYPARPLFDTVRRARGKARKIIFTCAFSEPCQAALHRLIVEQPDRIVGGAKILLRAVGAEKGVFAVPGNREEEAEKLLKIVKTSDAFSVVFVSAKYPAAEKCLVLSVVTGKKLRPDEEPEERGVSIVSALACYHVFEAFCTGLPQITCALSVSGEGVVQPKNLIVPIGVSLREAADRCGGFSRRPERVLSGGVMRGRRVENPAARVTRCTSALVSAPAVVSGKSYLCLQCGRCAAVCPTRLVPTRLYHLLETGKSCRAVPVLRENCLLCGCCSAVCPAGLPLAAAFARAGQIQEKSAPTPKVDQEKGRDAE